MRVSDPHLQTRLDLPEFMTMFLNPKSRDEMVRFIAGLRGVYADEAARREILEAIRRDVVGERSMDLGRLGLPLWSIFVLLAAKTALNRDYDALEDLAENHRLIRRAMGFGDFQSHVVLEWKRIWDNVRRVSPETLALINARVVHLGHREVPTAPLVMRADSFVMQTNIHHPSDIRQLDDALRCMLRHGSRLAELLGSTLLRQHKHLVRQQRRLRLRASLAIASRGRGREERVASAVQDFCDFAAERDAQAVKLLGVRPSTSTAAHVESELVAERKLVSHYRDALGIMTHVVRTRLIDGKPVELNERLFSIFEQHTECIHRGKARAAVEFGHRCLIVEDSAGFIVHATVMDNGTQDRELTIPVTRQLTRKFKTLRGISWDRGFHSPENQAELAKISPGSCLPTTGTHAAIKQNSSVSATWKNMRRNHPGIEAAIGNLEINHGCRVCPNKGSKGYARHLASAVLAANLITLGRHLIAKEHPGSNAATSKRKPPPIAA
jgi:transposase, IS5 family